MVSVLSITDAYLSIVAICCAAAIVLLYRNVRAIRDEAITKAYFFSEPSMGHQVSINRSLQIPNSNLDSISTNRIETS
jgi:hypothetical protein